MSDPGHLNRARQAFARGDWPAAHEAFARASQDLPLSGADLESWATAAYLLGQDDEFVRLLDSAHQRHLDHGDVLRAARCTAWLACNLAAAGAQAPAAGWVSRTRRLLAGAEGESAQGGYLALAESLTAVQRGDREEVVSAAERAVAAGSRFHDHDLESLALHVLGRAELRRSRVDEGLALLDEAMTVLASSVTNPFVIGIVYCSVIDACRSIFSLRRAHEWTEALGRWCDTQPGLVAFHGECSVARAEMLVLRGAWMDAAAEANRAAQRVALWAAPRIGAAAMYQLAEVHRLRGDFTEAEGLYEQVARESGQPYPGLALLKLRKSDPLAAYRSLVMRLDETRDPLKRVRLLPAVVEAGVALLAGDVNGQREEVIAEVRTAAAEIGQIADVYHSPALRAMADHAAGEVALVRGDVPAAAAALRSAADAWYSLEAPYQAARARASLGRAYLVQGDAGDAELEFAAARAVFEELGAKPDLKALDALTGSASDPSGLSPRELQVLSLLANGASNRSIATELGISERTVERHVSNIFDKLAVGSRTEAAAYALRNGLV